MSYLEPKNIIDMFVEPKDLYVQYTPFKMSKSVWHIHIIAFSFLLPSQKCKRPLPRTPLPKPHTLTDPAFKLFADNILYDFCIVFGPKHTASILSRRDMEDLENTML